jgi:hypothetical protein
MRPFIHRIIDQGRTPAVGIAGEAKPGIPATDNTH